MLAMDAPDGDLPGLGGMFHPAKLSPRLYVVRCGGEGLDDGAEEAQVGRQPFGVLGRGQYASRGRRAITWRR